MEKLKEIGKAEYELDCPTIKIDTEAIRFEFCDGQGTNLFFNDLFTGVRIKDWQGRAMEAIKKAYDECIIRGVYPKVEEDD